MILKQLKIGGHIVDVAEVTDHELNNDCGENWTEYNIIRLNKKYPKSQKAETLLHEILHHVLTQLGYECDPGAKNGYVHSERVVEGLAQGLYQVLHDNKLKF